MKSETNQSAGQRVTDWAKAVVAGRIVAGELAVHAAERHLRDLADGHKRGLMFDEKAAGRVIRFFPTMLRITAGAKAKQPFHLLDWQMFTAGNIFGWKYSKTGRLRFRTAWMETGKGQAKSPFMGGCGLYMMGWHGIPRAEVYSIGWEKKTANILFQDAVSMVRADTPGHEEGDSLETRGTVMVRGVMGNAWKLEHPASESFFQALANTDAISGPRPALVAADEIHEFKNADQLDTWAEAIVKQAGDALMMLGTNTPATSQIVGTDISERCQKIVKGDYDDDETFVYIARVDKADRETIFDNEQNWAKSLPALGITFPIENIRGSVASARTSTSKAAKVKRLYFGIPTDSVNFWMDDEEAWESCQSKEPFDLKAMKGLKCYLALDLSDKNDLTALTAVWVDKVGRLWSKTWYWTARVGLEDRAISDNAPYMKWVEEGYLIAVPGKTIDKSFIVAQVQKICAEHDVDSLSFDVAGIADFISECDDAGFPVWMYEGPKEKPGKGLKLVKHAQGKKRLFEEKQLTMPTSIEKIEDAILKGNIIVEKNPVTTMCAANTMVESDGQNNRCFNKARSRGRIDGMVTNAMGVGAATAELKVKKKEPQMFIIGGS